MKKIIKILKIFLLSFFTLILSVWAVLAWTWLIPQNGDTISISKWIELVTELNSKVWTWNLLAWTNITLTNSWSDLTIASSWWGIAPFISNTWSIKIATSTNIIFSLDWVYFTPSSNVTIPWFDWTINSVTSVSPSQIDVDLTTWIAETNFDIVIENSWVYNTVWTWNWVWLLSVWPIIWNWPAWIYTEDFETNTLWNWTEVTWLTADVSFQTVTWWTPSWGTGPNAAAGWLYYIYTEASNPNNPNFTFAVETDNFRNAQNISFDYHMFWTGMWDIKVQTLYNSVWTDVLTITWQQQALQADPWLNTWNIDLTPYNVEKIRLFSTSWTDYMSDVSIDNVVINSI